jgi:cytochrome c5
MSDQPHVSPIKNWKQLVVVVVAAFVVPIVLIILFSQLVTSGKKGGGDDDSGIIERIKPIGDVMLASGAGAPAAAGAAGATPVVAAAAGPVSGKKVYDSACVACHATGAAGSPKFGDKAAWAPRLKTGAEALYASALKGKGAMPPKGGFAALSDAEIKAGVDFMAAAGK